MLNNGYGEDEKNKCQIIQREGQWIVWYKVHEGAGGVMEWQFNSFEEVMKWHKDEFARLDGRQEMNMN